MGNQIFNTEPMNFDNASALLNNADRGLRLEACVTLGSNLTTYPTKCENPFDEIYKLIEKYDDDCPKLCQLYVYLSNYSNKNLDDLAFQQLEMIFDKFRANGIRLLLRFAYSTESIPDVPYSLVKIHLTQIKEWFNDNEKLVNDILYCLQTGVIGFWGEGHSYKNLKWYHIGKVINDVCDLAPKGIYTQVRSYKMLKKVDIKNIDRVGFHDDYIIGDLDHKWTFAPQHKRRAFIKAIEHSKFTINDGEMPWGYAHFNDLPNEKLCNNLNGIDVLKQLSLFHFSSLSLEHNYKENGENNSMEKWKNEMLSYDDVQKLGICVNPNLFRNQNNENIKLSIYDIIIYHLGYQLMISDCRLCGTEFSFSITNYGFAAPLNFNYLAVVVEGNNELREIEVEDYDKLKLQSGCKIQYKIEIPSDLKIIGIKMDTFKNRGINVVFSNQNLHKKGMMIL